LVLSFWSRPTLGQGGFLRDAEVGDEKDWRQKR
jgi:hypothetical protein